MEYLIDAEQWSQFTLFCDSRKRKSSTAGKNSRARELKDYASDVLPFLLEPDVPFTNNQANRELRMIKCKQKISGCFRAFDYALDFANIRSVLSTARKAVRPRVGERRKGTRTKSQNLNLLDVLIHALSGQPPIFS